VRNKAYKEAEDMCASGQCATALVQLQTAIYFGHLPSLALKAWLLTGGREGVAKDWKRGFEFSEEGARLGCHHCQGVLADYYFYGSGCDKDQTQSLELAHMSSERGSRYGQYTLGEMHHFGAGGFAHDYTQALAFYRLAAAQGLDAAQFTLGHMYYHGLGVAQEYAEALRFFQLSAAQGHPLAMRWIANCYEEGQGVFKNKYEAIRWYRRA
jgi:TPR repeat protein